ncbi:Piso0_001435 [Millerozyma farinosa CBS 7064]|uniref:Piso0_001435 protein n=1 Tax=Pichia sorbitophila (strain ATCC MYA-4447 / BCRC 22081 / CBS 7064 / NBRC 10061 / NRRL Y-12695) TaxID=559304 RepID=G8YN58_PICSO|nr:Piso0_001435 [Millerozyma farinosa CBS 7064]
MSNMIEIPDLDESGSFKSENQFYHGSDNYHDYNEFNMSRSLSQVNSKEFSPTYDYYNSDDPKDTRNVGYINQRTENVPLTGMDDYVGLKDQVLIKDDSSSKFSPQYANNFPENQTSDHYPANFEFTGNGSNETSTDMPKLNSQFSSDEIKNSGYITKGSVSPTEVPVDAPQSGNTYTFKLLDPPSLREKFPEERSDSQAMGENVNINGDWRHGGNITPSISMADQFSSPLSQYPQYDSMKVSPQLPPPVSASSNVNKITLSNGEESGLTRKDLATYSKTPTEYTLHIIFTQFVRHAERKLNMCLEYSLLEEPPIFDILSEGVDPQFDKILASLGYIARHKPKPVIDSVMFWRKSKSEVASMAASEVERVLASVKSNISKINSSTSLSSVGSSQNTKPQTKSKRSLSLMRSKSISRLTHSRSQSASALASSQSHSSPTQEDRKSSEMDVNKQKAIYDEQLSQAREIAIQADRKSLASIFILCRVLIEVVKQASWEVSEDNLYSKLEDIVFTQLRTTDPISTSKSLVRSANWSLFAKLLGEMSEKRFWSVSDRFIASLEKVPTDVTQDNVLQIFFLIEGMKYLKLTNYPLEKFEESADFMVSIAKFFSRAKHESIIYAYCEAVSSLILPLANILTAEANHPSWTEAIEKIYQKGVDIWKNTIKVNNSNTSSSNIFNLTFNSNNPLTSYLLGNSNTWAYSLHLITSALSVSSRELFNNSWFELIENNLFKLKVKSSVNDRCTFIICTSRLLWVYLNRLNDTLNNTVKHLDKLLDWFFGSSLAKKQHWITADPMLVCTVVVFLRIMGHNHFNYVLDKGILPLLKSSYNGSSLENANFERLIITFKSFFAILENYERGNSSEFPTDELFDKLSLEYEEQSNINLNISSKKEIITFVPAKKILQNSTSKYVYEEVAKLASILLKQLDSQYGCDLWNIESGSNQSTPILSSKGQSTFGLHFGLDFNYQSSKDTHLTLFATLLESVPWFMSSSIGEKINLGDLPFKNVVAILTRNAIHPSPKIAASSLSALSKLASRKNAGVLITMFAKYAFQFSDKPSFSFKPEFSNSESSFKLLKIYTYLLSCWLQQFKKMDEEKVQNKSSNPFAQDDETMNGDVLNDLYQINYKTTLPDQSGPSLKPGDELEWKTVITIVEEVEGNGLFFLCSQDSQTRSLGLSILKMVEQFDQTIYNITDRNRDYNEKLDTNKSHSRNSSKFAADIGTRLIHVLEDTDFLELIRPLRKELSVPEKTRLTKTKNKKNMLVKLAGSDYGIDSTLWFRLFPKLLDIFFERCPMPVALCRSIVCVRMVQMYELIYDYSESQRSYTSSFFSRQSYTVPPEVLVNQWRLYLIFACCSLTSTSEQKMTFPSQPTHGRKRSLHMFIQHQKITSAKSVFRMVIPFLKSQQQMIREAVISGLSCSNINILRTLLENLPESVNEWQTSKHKRDVSEDRSRIAVVHVLCNISSRFKSNTSLYSDEWIVANFLSIIKNVKTYLSLPRVQTDIESQKLRRYFCTFLENTFLGLYTVSDVEKWFPFEARIGCFNYLKEWCGYGDSRDITEERYEIMLKSAHSNKDAASTLAILEIEKLALKFASLSAMATLCLGNIKQKIEIGGKFAVMSFDIVDLMNWIHDLCADENERIHEIGQVAFRNIVKLNIDNEEIYQIIVKECYAVQSTSKVTEIYFTTLVESLVQDDRCQSLPYDVMCLASFFIGNDNYEIRHAAMKLLMYLEDKFFQSKTIETFSECVYSKVKVVYKKALFDISTHLASIPSGDAFERISYLTMYFNLVDNNSRRDILSCLLPWVQSITLETMSDEGNSEENSLKSADIILEPKSKMVINNLFEITVNFSSKISNEVEALWVALGRIPKNFDIIIEYLMKACVAKKSSFFVQYSRQIIDYLAYSQPDMLHIIDKLIDNLHPRVMVPPLQSSDSNVSAPDKELPYVADLSSVIGSNEKDAAFSLGMLSAVFLVDLLTVRSDRMVEKLPLLLHASFVLLDHYLLVVQEQAARLLIHLLHALAPNEPKSIDTMNALRQRDHFKFLWVYDDLNNDKKGARTPKNMDLLARSIIDVFVSIAPGLQEEWSRTALNWATTCAVRHIACRSFQLFRSLLSSMDQNMLKDMLHRLSNTISDESVDIQGFSMQILMTLNAITAELDPSKLIDFPQLFWSSVACLSTINEQEFIEVLSTMSKFVSKIDLDAPDTVSCLISTFPPKWEGKFEGLQQIVMIGLRSANAWEPTIKFLDRLIELKDSEIIGMGDHRLLMTLLANIPRFLHALDQKKIRPEIQETATILSEKAEQGGKLALSRLLMSLSKNKFRSKNDFLVQSVSTISTLFFPEYEAQILVILLGFLFNKINWIKLETLNLLKHLLPLVDLQKDEFIGVGADLISPLLRLLLTDYAEPALEVLDEAVTISGSKLDKDILRMSLGNTSIKKEYAKTATLFGIPEESGWVVPMPAVTAASTRNNVHTVFSTCNVSTVAGDANDEKSTGENIQFHSEDYAPPADYADTLSAGVEEPDDSLSNMWAALDDFDSFFTKDTDQNGQPPLGLQVRNDRKTGYGYHMQHPSVDSKMSTTSDYTLPMDSAPHVYDNKVSMILNRSLARTQSNTSFKNGFSDSVGTTNQETSDLPHMPKKSYIPFKNMKPTGRSKLDRQISFSSLSPGSEHTYSASFRSPTLTPGSFFPQKEHHNQPNEAYPQSLGSHGSSDNITKLETLIHPGKRKSKRNTFFSPSSSNSVQSNEAYNHNRRSKEEKGLKSPMRHDN